jgi:hypothetical protein
MRLFNAQTQQIQAVLCVIKIYASMMNTSPGVQQSTQEDVLNVQILLVVQFMLQGRPLFFCFCFFQFFFIDFWGVTGYFQDFKRLSQVVMLRLQWEHQKNQEQEIVHGSKLFYFVTFVL